MDQPPVSPPQDHAGEEQQSSKGDTDLRGQSSGDQQRVIDMTAESKESDGGQHDWSHSETDGESIILKPVQGSSTIKLATVGSSTTEFGLSKSTDDGTEETNRAERNDKHRNDKDVEAPAVAASESSSTSPKGAGATAANQQGIDSFGRVLAAVAVACITGFITGFGLEKSRVFEPTVIQQQFLFENWTMMYVFLSILAVSAAVVAFINLVDPIHIMHARNSFVGAVRQRGIVTALIPGGLLTGIGMGLGGACPLQLPVQLGSGTPDAYVLLLGLLLGGLIYSLLEPVIKQRLINAGPKMKTTFVGEDPPRRSTSLFGFGMAACCVAGLIVLGHFAPWRDNTVRVNPPDCGTFDCVYWSPYAAGIAIGACQLLVVAISKDTVGASTCYVTLLSGLGVFLAPFDKDNTRYNLFRSLWKSLTAWAQVAFVFSAAIGSLVSAALSDSLSATKSPPVAANFVSGILLMFGSRLAGGCVFGHGISGDSLLLISSFIVVPSVWAGGIATAFLYQHLDSNYPHW